MTAIKRLRWPLLTIYVLAMIIAVAFALPSGLALLGLPPERVTFLPATLTGLPWSLSTLTVREDSVTTLALVLVSNLLNLAIAGLAARGAE